MEEGVEAEGCSVTVNLLFFAKARELVGRPTDTLTTSDNPTLQELTATLLAVYPQLKCLDKRFIVAHNQTYVSGEDDNIALKTNDEIAIIPPISGG